MCAEDLATHVDGEQFFDMRRGDIGQRNRLSQTGIVDQHVQTAEVSGGGAHDLGAYGG